MPPQIATLAVLSGAGVLIWLDRDRDVPASRALWIPVLWLWLCASRTASQWLGIQGLSGSSEQFLEGSPLDAATYFGLVVAALMVLATRRERLALFLWANGPLVLFLLYCGASVLWSDFPLVTFKRWIKASGDFFILLVVLTDPDPVVALKGLLSRVGFMLVPVSILLIRYYPTLGRAYSEWTGAAYNIGVATGKNGLGYVALLFGLGGVWRLCEALRGNDNGRLTGPLIANSVLLLLVLWVFQLANSATSLFCFLMGSILIAVASLRTAWKSILVHALVVVMLVVVVYGLLLNPDAGLAEMAGRDSTLTGRTRLWNQALGLTVDPLLGAGYEAFWLGDRIEQMWRLNWDQPNQAHNGYLEIFLDLGWVGVALLAFLMIRGYRNVSRALSWGLASAPLRVAFFFVAAAYNLTEHGFRELHPIWIAFLVAIIAVPEPLVHQSQESAGQLENAPQDGEWSVAEA